MIKKVLFSFVILFSFISCQIGLGEAIDLQPPKVQLTSHNDNDSVAQTFTLKGTASDNYGVESIYINFEDSAMYFKYQNGQWLKKTGNKGWQSFEEAKSEYKDSLIYWEIPVDYNEGNKKDTNLFFSIEATDKIGNSGKDSKIECAVIVDENMPIASIIKPELQNNYDTVLNNKEKFQLKDGNVISQLLNGNIVLEGRLDGSASFRQLLIELDNGTTSGNCDNNDENIDDTITAKDLSLKYPIGSASSPYYEKTLTPTSTDDLRSWRIEIPQDDFIKGELSSGRHIIRVVSTSISKSNAWERKVLGFFILDPAADTPWISPYIGADADTNVEEVKIYPKSKISGMVQDDDGIDSLKYSLYKKDEAGTGVYSIYENIQDKILNLSEKATKASQWAFEAPQEGGIYKLILTVKDVYGKLAQNVKYFQIMDVKAPKIQLSEPDINKNIIDLIDSNGNLTFKGTVSDDGKIKSLKFIHLNPANSSVESAVEFINGNNPKWDINDEDSNKNIIFPIDLQNTNSKDENGNNVYSFTKTINIFEDLKIDGVNKELTAQDFIFNVMDTGNTTTTQFITIKGDTESPSLEINSLTVDGTSYSFENNNIPNIPKLSDSSTIIFNGTWGENSYSKINKIKNFTFEWNSTKTITPNSNGTWTLEVPYKEIPKENKSIKIEIQDYAGNVKTVQKSIFIEKTDIELANITSETDPGSFTTGKKIVINLEFTKNAIIKGTNPTLTLNNGGTAVWQEASNGKAKHQFVYTVGDEDDEIDELKIRKINGDWQDANTYKDCPIGTIDNSFFENKTYKIDKTAPTIQSILPISDNGWYSLNQSIIYEVTFNEEVEIENLNNLNMIFEGNISFNDKVHASNKIIFNYKVEDGIEVNSLKFKQFENNSVVVKDIAGNLLQDWTFEHEENTDIKIDANKPAKPLITTTPANIPSVIIDDSGFSFEIKGETGAKIEYSIDEGKNWTLYNNKVTIKNNGTYNVICRQTDKANNVSDIKEGFSVLIDKGPLLKNITTENPNGKYSKDVTIKGIINFRVPVKFQNGAKLKLNIGDDDVPILNPTTESNKFEFVYEIKQNDKTNLLNIEEFPTTVLYKNKEVNVSLTDDINIKANRTIEVDAIPLEVDTDSFELPETNKLTINFNKKISKNGSGDITLSIEDDDYEVPYVLSKEEYDEFGETLSSYYTKALNGAELNNDGSLVKNSKTMYVLNYDYEETENALKTLFINKSKNSISIPLVSEIVTINEKSLTIDLSGDIKLPISGTDFTIDIPADSFIDEFKNTNIAISTKVSSKAKPEAPVIRMEKYKDTMNGTRIKFADSPQIKINSRTKGANVHYVVHNEPHEQVSYKGVEIDEINYKPQFSNFVMNNNDKFESAFNISSKISDFDSDKGYSVGIKAISSKNNKNSDPVYDTLSHTVLILNIDGHAKADYQGSNYLIWLLGSDSVLGGNVSDVFPLSSTDKSKFKLMDHFDGTKNSGDSLANQKWQWKSWDLPSKAYFVFALQPNITITSGVYPGAPENCYEAEDRWANKYAKFPLCPGAKLEMKTSDGNDGGGSFYFRTKNSH